VDSANINLTNMKLFGNNIYIYCIYPDILNGISKTELVKFNLTVKDLEYISYEHIAVTTNTPLKVNNKFYYYGKNRLLDKPNHLVKLDSLLSIEDSIPISLKGDYNFPTRPYYSSKRMYLPSYIEDGEQEYFSITKVTPDLRVLWTKYFNEEYAYSVPAEILASPDSNLYVSSNVYVKDNFRYFNQLLKLDTSGNVIWEFFNTEEVQHGAVSPWFTTLSDSNIVVSYRVDRFTNDTFRTKGLHFIPYRLIWLDSNGDLIKKKYYVSNRLKRFFITNVEAGREDYFFVMGQWDDGEALETKNLLIKLNNQGDSLWHRTYYHPDYSLDSVSLHIVDIHEFQDGRIAVLSMITTPYDYDKIWLYMVDSNGNCLTDNCICEGEVVGVNSYEVSYERLKVYPNPTSGMLKWDDRIQLKQLTVFDLLGRKVLHSDDEWLNSIRVDHLSSGKYILLGVDREGRHYRTKFVKQF
jgi:hypothetical protein